MVGTEFVYKTITPCNLIEDGLNFTQILFQTELPELENDGSERLRSFLTYLLDNRPNGASFILVRYVH